jgi:AGZA family xanthine/uracil permease-like MFS transporter
MKFFALKENNTTVKTEVLAGLTTFTAMVYILVVNPAILSVSGMPAEAVLGATIFSSALMTLSMAFFTNLPVALAPGMGLNAFFTFTLCMGVGMSWQAALGLVFYSGVLFLIMTLTGLRRKLLNLIPESVRHGLTVGIGLFITLIGLKNAGIIVPHPATLITLGNVRDPQTWVILGGILLAGYFHLRRISAGLLLSILFISVCLVTLGKAPLPESFFSLPPSMGDTFFKLDLAYFWQNPWQCIPLVLSLFLVDLFDNLGTLLAVCSRARLVDEKGEIRNIDRALKADAFAAMTGAILGTSSVTSYIESAAGVEQGGRTGLTSVTVAVCFLLSLFLAPVFLAIPLAATTPALVLVGFFMISEITRVDFGKIETALPAFITMIMIPFTFSIAEGLAMGLVTYFIFRILRRWV